MLHSLFGNERIYANAMQQSKMNSQFVTATQPLAPLLSRDSFLCLDGEFMGLYSPWRDVYHGRESYSREEDRDLHEYLQKKNAFDLPPVQEQIRLVQLYLDNLYPLYPVVERTVLHQLKKVPLMLLNALMLSGIRYDKTTERSKIRLRAQQLRDRCRYLEMMETNKITLIQSLLLLSGDEEGPEGPLLARSHASRACVLSMELGIHMFGARTLLDNSMSSAKQAQAFSSSYKLSYNMALLARLFWVAFCADRVLSATTSSALFINRLDIIIDEPSVEIFEAGEYQQHDFEIFKRWYDTSTLIERILAMEYRPPGRRVVDLAFERDMAGWFDNNFPCPIMEDKFVKFFIIVSTYCAVLYLRCRVDFMTLLENQTSDEYIYDNSSSQLPLSNNKMFYIKKFRNAMIEALEEEEHIQHITVVHSILHNLVLLQLEIQTRQNASSDSDIIGKNTALFERYMNVLENAKDKWWFAAAAYYLCKEINKSNPHSAENGTNEYLTNIDLATVDSTHDLLGIVFDNSFLNSNLNFN